MTAALRLKPWFRGRDPLTPQPPLLVPEAEPLSQGEPPITPDLVTRVSLSWPRRSVGCRSGQRVTCSLATAPRPRVSVVWGGLTKADRDTLLSFIHKSVESTARAFGVRPDGPAGELVTVRAIADAVDTWQSKGAYSVTVECEEVF